MTDTTDMTELPSTTPVPANGTAITMTEYGGLQEAFDVLNAKVFDDTLPDAFIVYTRKPHSRGHFSDDRYSTRDGKFKKPEISLNPDSFIERTDKQIVSTLAHEMVHEWQSRFGKASARGYHNKEWAAKMKSIGLMPSNSGAIGGKETGQQMSHYVIPGGLFDRVFDELAGGGWKLNLQSTIHAGGNRKKSNKTTYICPDCAANSWGKPQLGLVCKNCLINNLINLSWIDEGKAADLFELIVSKTMMPQSVGSDVASSRDGGSA